MGDRERNKGLFKQSLNHYTILFAAVLLLTAVVIFVIKLAYGHYTVKDFGDDLFNSLIGAILPIVLFNIIFEYFIRSRQSEEISKAIARTLLLERETIKPFKEDEVKSFISHATQSLVGNEEGEMLYETLFSPYLSKTQRFRRNFKYYIFYMTLDKAGGPSGVEIFDKDSYIWVMEDLSYEKKFDSPAEALDQDLAVGFSYNEQKLESYFKDARIVFRENLAIESAEIAAIDGLDEDGLKRFAREELQFAMEIEGVQAKLVGAMHDEGNGFILKFRRPMQEDEKRTRELAEQQEGGAYYRIKMKFRMPQLKHKKKFVAVISEPTHNVNILFSNQLPDGRVTTAPFFDREETMEHLPNGIISIELPRWVLPTSGVVFMWEEHGATTPVPAAPPSAAAG